MILNCNQMLQRADSFARILSIIHSVTRLDKNSPFGLNFENLQLFLASSYCIWQEILNLLWLTFYAFGQISLLSLGRLNIEKIRQPSGHTDLATHTIF